MTDQDPREPGVWWREGVFYQIYPRSYQDSDGDGVGDLPGITSRLDHLNGTPDSLGIDAIWISPFQPSPMADFGYDVSDYCGVDPRFGTLEDFDTLLAAAHERGIRVIVDLVPNHSSDQHPWFIESRSSRTNPMRDWYVWADPKPDGSPPNNWQSTFTRVQLSAWTLDATTGQYYLHGFLPQQPDLNWWNPDVRTAFDEILRFWLDRGADGFRIDVAHKMAHDPELRDNPPPRPGLPTGTWTDEDAPGDADWPEVHEIHRRFRRILDGYDDRMAIGEVYLLDPRRLVRYYGERNDELHLAFNFSFLRAPWTASGFRDNVEMFERLLPDGAWPDYTLSNHDHSRAVSRYAGGDIEQGRRRARLAALMLLTLRGTPFIYQGEEIGMADGDVPPERIVDIDGRDPERTPMAWDGTPTGGFTTGDPWLPVNAETASVNVAAQRGVPGSMLELYRELLRVRRSSPALRRGTYRALDGAPADVFAYTREWDGQRRVVVLNFGAGPERVPVGAGLRVVLSSDPARAAGPVTGSELLVESDEGVLLAPVDTP